VTPRKRAVPGCNLPRLQQRRRSERPRSDDLSGAAVLIEEHRIRDLFILDERFGVLPAAGSDCGDRGTGGDDLVVSVADLTGPFTAGQSPEVSKEEQNLRLFRPEVTESLLGALGIDEDQVGQLCRVEWHGVGSSGLAKDAHQPYYRSG
jgi:hypothetical protein